MIESTGNQPVTKRIGNKFNLLMESTSGLGGGGGTMSPQMASFRHRCRTRDFYIKLLIS